MSQAKYFYQTEEKVMEYFDNGKPFKPFFMDQVYLTPRGFLAVGNLMYRADEYCLFNYL